MRDKERRPEDCVCSIHPTNGSSTRFLSLAGLTPHFAGDNHRLGHDNLEDIAWEVVEID